MRLRFYAGLKMDEVAALLGVSARTVKLDFAFARAWLMRKVKYADAGENSESALPSQQRYGE